MKTITDEALFDIIAPIAIYTWADLKYAKQAQSALRKLRTLVKRGAPLDARINPNTVSQALSHIDQFLVRDIYNTLFERIVYKHQPQWQAFTDHYGAYGFKDQYGHVVFTGDDSYAYPWYETANLVEERVRMGR